MSVPVFPNEKPANHSRNADQVFSLITDTLTEIAIDHIVTNND